MYNCLVQLASEGQDYMACFALSCSPFWFSITSFAAWEKILQCLFPLTSLAM